MRKEWVVVVIIIIVAGWWLLSQKKEEVQVVKCPSTCEYGCIPNTAQCREPPPLACPPTCKYGCIDGTNQCKPGVVEPKKNQIMTCGVVNETSELTANLDSEKSCLIIENNNLTLDCKGYRITSNRKEGSYAIHVVGRNNITIKNCIIQNYTSGIVINESSNISVFNITVNDNKEYGISVDSSNYTLLKEVTASRNERYGIRVSLSSNTTIQNSKIRDNTYGLYIQLSKSTMLLNNLMCFSSIIDVKCYYPDIIVDKSNFCSKMRACGLNCKPC